MFPKRLIPVLAILALFSCAACAHIPRLFGGTPDEELTLDGEQRHEVTINVSRTLTLDLRDPRGSGYVFSGTAFDPTLLRLDSLEPTEGGKRVRYLFTGLAQGECDITIKIRKPEPNYPSDIYKLVHVTIEK